MIPRPPRSTRTYTPFPYTTLFRADGINIAAPRGTPVRAAENGVVAYAGEELKGFGKLLLVKHADGWVTAYAHNEALLVSAGDTVRQGQDRKSTRLNSSH